MRIVEADTRSAAASAPSEAAGHLDRSATATAAAPLHGEGRQLARGMAVTAVRAHHIVSTADAAHQLFKAAPTTRAVVFVQGHISFP